jgi:hypothetical protein
MLLQYFVAFAQTVQGSEKEILNVNAYKYQKNEGSVECCSEYSSHFMPFNAMCLTSVHSPAFPTC